MRAESVDSPRWRAGHRVPEHLYRDDVPLATMPAAVVSEIVVGMTAWGATVPASGTRVVSTTAELDALGIGAVVLDGSGVARQHLDPEAALGRGWSWAGCLPLTSELLADGRPMVVLHEGRLSRATTHRPVRSDLLGLGAREAGLTVYPATDARSEHQDVAG